MDDFSGLWFVIRHISNSRTSLFFWWNNLNFTEIGHRKRFIHVRDQSLNLYFKPFIGMISIR